MKQDKVSVNDVLYNLTEIASKDVILRRIIAGGLASICFGLAVSMMVIASGVYHHLVGR